MFLKSIQDEKIISQLKNLVGQEREILAEILYHLLEMQERKLHLAEGYPSLYVYCVKVLNYTEAQAYRRIAAMQLLKEIPELKTNIESGVLNLTHLTQAKKHFKAEAENSTPLSKEEKLDVLISLNNKTTRETEKFFAKLNPEAIPEDKERVIRENLTEIRFVASDALLEKFKRFKEMDSHALPNPNYAELFERLVDLALREKEKKLLGKENQNSHLHPSADSAVQRIAQKKTKSFVAPKKRCVANEVHQNAPDDKNKNETVAATFIINRSRVIPISIKRIVIKRDGFACTFVNPTTGKKCGSKYRLQFEHIHPFAKNGDHSAENITLLCQNHNLFRADQSFGREKMRSYSGFSH